MYGLTLWYIIHGSGVTFTHRVEVRVGNDPSIKTGEHFIGMIYNENMSPPGLFS